MIFAVAVWSMHVVVSAQPTITPVGGDLTTNDGWRSTGVAKSLDTDGDDIYGTDGYVLFGSASSAPVAQPSYASAAASPGTSLFGPSGIYVNLDDPAFTGAAAANSQTGTVFRAGGAGVEHDLIVITLSQDKSFRVGVIQDHHDLAAISPAQLRLRQTSGGTANSGLMGASTDRDRDGDYYFFDVVGAQTGDVFVLSGVNDGGHSSNGVYGVTFDILAVPIDVNSTADNLTAGDGFCTLREAIRNANTDGDTTSGDCPAGFGDDTINLPAGTYTLTIAGRGEDAALTGDLDFTDTDKTTIAGAGARTTIIQAGTSSPVPVTAACGDCVDRVFHLLTGASVEMSGVTIRHGNPLDSGGGIQVEGVGTALIVRDARLTSNHAERASSFGADGGGISVAGTAATTSVTIERSLLDNNRASGHMGSHGGGLIVFPGGTVVITNSTISGNTTQGGGGAILSQFDSGGSVTLNHVTVTGNSTGLRDQLKPGNVISIKNSIVSGNGTPECAALSGGVIASAGYNIVGTNGVSDGCPFGGMGDQILAAATSTLINTTLANNGGPTDTHALVVGAAAVDAIASGTSGCGTTFTDDQRGTTRPLGGSCDMGAFEAPPTADLSVSKSDSADPVNASSSYSYTVNVSNAGAATATNVEVTDTLPPGVSFVSATGTGWSCSEAAGVVTCTRASLAVGAAPAITISVTAPSSGGSITNNVSVSADETDPVSGNDSGSEMTAVTAIADLSVSKSDSADPVSAAGSFSYTVSVSNGGPSTATNVSVTDTLPPGVGFVSASGTGWACSEAGGVVTCTRSSLAVGAAPDITISVTAPSSGGVITNNVSVSAMETDPVAGNDSASEMTTVTAVADLVVTKTDSVDPVIAGNDLTYTVTVTNNGPSDAQDVVVTDTLPAGVTLVSTSGCAEDPSGVATCTLGTIAASSSDQYTITVTVDSATTGVLTNTAAVASSTTLTSTGDDSVMETTTVSTSADLVSTKTDSVDPVIAGNDLTYTITVTNNGPSDAHSVVATDPLPSTVTLLSTSGCPEDPTGAAMCTLGSIIAGSSAEYTVTVNVNRDARQDLTNEVSVTSSTPDGNPDNTDSEESTTVLPIADVEVVLKGPESVVVGEDVKIRATVTNLGPSPAEGIRITTLAGSTESSSVKIGSISCSGGFLVVCSLGTAGARRIQGCERRTSPSWLGKRLAGFQTIVPDH